MPTDVMIQTKGLTKDFGPVRALDNVSFEVCRGEVVGFLGPNGAGKSTTMRILTSFIAPTEGTASIHGYDVFSASLEARKRMGYLPQRAPLYMDMDVDSYLRFVGQIRGLADSEYTQRRSNVVEVCGLSGRLGQTIGTLSHGYRQRVGLAQALLHDPPILILDEPTADLDPNEKAELLHYISRIAKDHTIFLSTHILSEVEAACGRAIIVNEGRIVADGSLDQIRRRGGGPRHVVTIEGDAALGLTTDSVVEEFAKLRGATGLDATVTDGCVSVEFGADGDQDLRRDIFQLAVERGWVLLESRRESLGLESVFRELTQEDELRSRGTASADRV